MRRFPRSGEVWILRAMYPWLLLDVRRIVLGDRSFYYEAAAVPLFSDDLPYDNKYYFYDDATFADWERLF